MGCSDSKSTASGGAKPQNQQQPHNQQQANPNVKGQSQQNGESDKPIELKFSGSVVLFAEISLKPDHDLHKVKHIVMELIRNTRKEPGCQIFSINAVMDENDKSQLVKLVILGKFKDLHSLHEHKENPLNKPFTEELMEFIDKTTFVPAIHHVVETSNDNIKPWEHERDFNRDDPECFVFIQFRPKPEFRNKVLMGGPSIIAPSRGERNCLWFEFCGVKDSEWVSFFGVFANAKGFEEHHAAEHIAKSMPEMMKMMAEEKFSMSFRME